MTGEEVFVTAILVMGKSLFVLGLCPVLMRLDLKLTSQEVRFQVPDDWMASFGVLNAVD